MAAEQLVAEEVVVGQLAAGRLDAGEMAAGEMAAGEIVVGELAAGEMVVGETVVGGVVVEELVAEMPHQRSQVSQWQERGCFVPTLCVGALTVLSFLPSVPASCCLHTNTPPSGALPLVYQKRSDGRLRP